MKTIMLTLTERCNLNCTYCYEKNKSLKTMSKETAIQILEKELQEDPELDFCEIQFFGGEPFYEFALMRELCEFLWSREWPVKYHCFVTTNGTLVHGEIQEWLREHKDRIICSLSLDGNKAAHDINRCNSFDLIDIDFFKETWPLQTCKMTISPKSLPYLADSIIYLHERGLRFDNNLAYGVDWEDEQLFKTMEEQLVQVSNYYITHPQIEPCRMLNMSLENILTEEKAPRWCGAGISLRAYDVYGNVYPCHLFEGMSMGEELTEGVKDIDFSKTINMDPRCEKCPIYNVCPTCYGHNYLATGDIAKRDESLCRFTKMNTLVASYIWLHRIQNYNSEELNMSQEKYLTLYVAAEKIQKELFMGKEKQDDEI